MHLPALLYHHVGPPIAGSHHPELTVAPEQFRRQVRWLARRGYAGIRASDWLAMRRGARALPSKPVLLTFDDAYADLLEHAFPVLEHHGFSAVVFVITRLVGGKTPWDGGRLMSADQIRHWAAKGIEFGGHSRTHPDLSTLNGCQLAEEIQGSAEDLAAILGCPATSFAYPYGTCNHMVRECARRAFEMAVTCEEGLNDLETDPYMVRRTMVRPGDSLIDLAFRVRRGRSPLQHWRERLGLRSRLRRGLSSLHDLLHDFCVAHDLFT
jgi:peptidoglycan/xylan/chitin deacetylase (PgdA/CDA1 family)